MVTVGRIRLRTVGYLYDESGNRIGKREGGAMVAGYVGGIYLDGDTAVVPMKIDGQLLGVWSLGASGNQFELVGADPLGTVFADAGVANLATPYGMRTQRPSRSAALDFVERGYDADLGTIRFGARDYDPKLGQFWSPDPLFLENLDKCAASPVECNLYGCARSNPLSWIDLTGREARTPEGRALRFAAMASGASDSHSFNWDTLARGSTLSGEEAANAVAGCSSNCRTWHDDVASTGAGFGDTLTFNATAVIREATTIGGATVHMDSYGYVVGTVGALVMPTGAAMLTSRLVSTAARTAIGTSRATTTVAASGVQANKIAGDAWSKAVGAELKATHKVAVPEITVKTQSGTRTRLDWVTKDATGTIGCVECKASATAPLTKNQAKAFPEIARSGAVVVGKGKPGIPGGTVIPPTTVQVRRP